MQIGFIACGKKELKMESVAQPLGLSSATASALVKLINGQYTAASVQADPKDAARLNLVKMKDGNYGVPPTDAALQTTPATLSAVVTLQLGGSFST